MKSDLQFLHNIYVKSRTYILVVLVPITIGMCTSVSVVAQSIADRGKEVYDQNCLACHQIDGGGVPMLTPSLVNAEWVQGDKVRLINVVLKGLQGVEINGDIYDNPMPPLTHLSDEDIAAVLTYIRANFNNKAGPIKKEEVAAARKAIK